MQVLVDIPNHLGIGRTILRAMHAVSSIPRTMTRDEAYARLQLLADDLEAARDTVQRAVDMYLSERPRPLRKRGRR
jgi:hypothetical protein